MNRSQIEMTNQTITAQYYKMLNEMALSQVPDRIMTQNEAMQYSYVRLTELSRCWLVTQSPIWMNMSDLYVGLYNTSIPVSTLFVSDGKEIAVYVGTHLDKVDILMGLLRGTFPQARYASEYGSGDKIFSFNEASIAARACTYGGFIKGNPTGNENFMSMSQIDGIIKGMSHKPWIISVFAQPVPKGETLLRQQQWLTTASECSAFSQLTYTDNDNVETITYKKNYCHGEQFCEKVNSFCEKANESFSMGEWCVTVNFKSTTPSNSRLLGGLFTAAFYGEHSTPEPIHALYMNEANDAVLVDGRKYAHAAYNNVPYPRYSTLLSSRELAVLTAFPTVDTAGFAVIDHVEFDVCREVWGDLSIGSILNNGRESDNTYTIDANEFNRHCLVVGLTGSGKTNTIKSLICGITQNKSCPLMVIEPAKKEYWELYKLGFDDLQIYSVGASDMYAHKLCINPFERAVFTDINGVEKAVPIQTHIDFVYAAFKASFIMYTPMPYVLERAIYAIYEDRGWDIHNNINIHGDDIYPTIEDLYHKIPEIVIEMGYDQKMRNDLIGSLQARINSMRLGTKGETLNVRRSFPMDKLLMQNTVIELEDIGDDDVKAFIISLLLVALLEYRRQQDDCQLEVRHLMLIEEAHRLLKNVQSGSGENADPRGAAVEFFCNLLAELRSKGQGFIVADQIPSKLAPDLIKNTNLKIVHRTVAAEERELIGGAMHMTPEQIDSLSSLKQGVAAVYSEGDHRPKLVKSPYVGSLIIPERKTLNHDDVLKAVSSNVVTVSGRSVYQSLTNTRHPICRHCEKKHCFFCEQTPQDIFKRGIDPQQMRTFFEEINPRRTGECMAETVYKKIQSFISQYAPSATPEMKYCMVQCVMEAWGISDKLKSKLAQVFINEY